MQKHEFEALAGAKVSDDEYRIIETVYQWHPKISNTGGKQEVAGLYKGFGMTIFHDMLSRANKAYELNEDLRQAEQAVADIRAKIEGLADPQTG